MIKLASIETVSNVFPHPNADSIEFVQVLGYKCIVKKNTYHIGDKIILIQPDTVLPDAPWTEFYKKRSRNRVKAQRLRGEWSFGIVENLSLLPDGSYDVGQEVSDILGIVKYEPPIPNDLQAKGNLPFGISKTDEERYQNLELTDYLGQVVDVTLKIDGQSCSFYYKHICDDPNFVPVFGITARSLELKPECNNHYTAHIARYNLENKLKAYCEKHNINLMLRGESYGPSIQKNPNNPHTNEYGWACFSVWLIDERCYAHKGHKHYFINVCEEMGVPYVPVLEKNVVLTQELIYKYDSGLKTIDGKPFEGVVVKGNNFTFKIINKWYDELKE